MSFLNFMILYLGLQLCFFYRVDSSQYLSDLTRMLNIKSTLPPYLQHLSPHYQIYPSVPSRR